MKAYGIRFSYSYLYFCVYLYLKIRGFQDYNCSKLKNIYFYILQLVKLY